MLRGENGPSRRPVRGVAARLRNGLGAPGTGTEKSNAVGIHAPLTDETRGLVGSEELRALGQDGILVNTARGVIVDEHLLVEALREDIIWGA